MTDLQKICDVEKCDEVWDYIGLYRPQDCTLNYFHKHSPHLINNNLTGPVYKKEKSANIFGNIRQFWDYEHLLTTHWNSRTLCPHCTSDSL
jgi:hypothetical protein